MKQQYDLELHRLARVSPNEKIVRNGNHLSVRRRGRIWMLGWLLEDAHLSRIFLALRSFLAIQAGEEGGLGQELVIEDLAGLRQRVREMKCRYDRKHGLFFRLFFDASLDEEYRLLMQQLDFVLSRVAIREMKRMNEWARSAVQRLREDVVECWLKANTTYENKIVEQIARLRDRLGADHQEKLSSLWRPNGRERVLNSKTLLLELWKQMGLVLEESQEIQDLIRNEMGHVDRWAGDLAICRHNEILSKLTLWRAVIVNQKRAVFDVLQDWHHKRLKLLERLYTNYEEVSAVVSGPELEELRELLVTREKAYLEMLEELQRGIVELLDDLRGGIRRVGRSLLTDEYLNSEMSSRWVGSSA